jgi:hypothetical protein
MQAALPTEKLKAAILTDRGTAPIKRLAPVLDPAHFLPPAKSMPREQFPWIVALMPIRVLPQCLSEFQKSMLL